jgi:Protein of unknown function (DUF4230)
MDFFNAFAGFVFVLALGVALGTLISWLWRRRSNRGAQTDLRSELVELRAIGELSVFRVVTKDILTHTDHSFGDFGRRYLKWAFSQKKLAMVFEFEIDFRFDLRDPALKIETGVITPQGGRFAYLTLPACTCSVLLRDLSFYDEQRARLLPWLLPDLLNGFLPTGFSEADKNQLITSAREHAQSQALLLLEKYKRDIEGSASQTLLPILRSLGARDVQVRFGAATPRVVSNVVSIDKPNSPAESETSGDSSAAAGARAA